MFEHKRAEVDLRELVNPRILSVQRVFEEYGVAPTGDPEPPSRPTNFAIYDGATAYLRVVLAGSPIPEWEKPLSVGDVLLVPSKGPVWVQRTYITRPNAPGIDYEKVHERTEAGHGRHLTIALVRFVVDTTHMSRLMATSSRKVASAAGILAALTDERFGLDVLAENALVVENGDIVQVFDVTRAVRHYVRDLSWRRERLVADVADERFADVRRSSHWYLKASQEGPTPDGIVWLCTAIECLVDPPPGRRRKTFSKAALERAVRAAGDDPSRFQPDLGKVAGLRSRVIHYGEEEPDALRDGYYVLEEVSRLLIRSHIGETTDWPLAVPNPVPTADSMVVEKKYRYGSEWVEPPR